MFLGKIYVLMGLRAIFQFFHLYLTSVGVDFEGQVVHYSEWSQSLIKKMLIIAPYLSQSTINLTKFHSI